MMIDLLRSRPHAVQRIDEIIQARRDLFVTPHILYELYRGVRGARDAAAEMRAINRIGEKFRLLPFDREAAHLAARMADALQQQGLEAPEMDPFIAASAVVWGDGEIVTRDEQHFRRLRRFGITVVDAGSG